MPKNVEIKAKIQSLEDFLSKARPMADQPEALLVQEDTYFRVPNGRLKLRETLGEPAQLVFYDRPDTQAPKLSKYNKQFFSNQEEAHGLKEILKASLGVRGVVCKSRTLIMVKQTRVHVDDVQQLGHYMELEVVLREDQSLEEGQKIAQDLMTKLGVEDKDLLSCSYIDLILQATFI